MTTRCQFSIYQGRLVGRRMDWQGRMGGLETHSSSVWTMLKPLQISPAAFLNGIKSFCRVFFLHHRHCCGCWSVYLRQWVCVAERGRQLSSALELVCLKLLLWRPLHSYKCHALFCAGKYVHYLQHQICLSEKSHKSLYKTPTKPDTPQTTVLIEIYMWKRNNHCRNTLIFSIILIQCIRLFKKKFAPALLYWFSTVWIGH